MPSGALVQEWRRLPVSLNLPLCHPRDGLFYPLRRMRVSLRSRPRRARAHVQGHALLPMPSFLPFSFLSLSSPLSRRGATSWTSPRTSWQAVPFHRIIIRHLSQYCSHHLSALILLTLTRLAMSPMAHSAHAAVGHRKAMAPYRRHHTVRHQAGHVRRQRMLRGGSNRASTHVKQQCASTHIKQPVRRRRNAQGWAAAYGA